MGLSDYHAHVLEAGSAIKKGETADPRLIRYNTAYYPADVGVGLVVRDIEDFRHLAELQEPRLSIELEKTAVSLDCALATTSSENGRRMNEFKNQQTMDRMNAKLQLQDEYDQMNYSQPKKTDGNLK